jgi:hypothetical protein
MGSSLRPLALAAALASVAAYGQVGLPESTPDEGWATFPEDRSRPPPPRRRAPLVPDGYEPAPPYVAPRAPEVVRSEPVPVERQEPNTVSLAGAQALGLYQRGFAVSLGFPLLGVRAGIGLFEGFDLGLVFESYYGAMNEFRGAARYQFLTGPHWAAAVVLDGGTALFAQRASLEDHQGRWVTGHRNYNLMPGLVFSYRGHSARAARLFLDVRYHLAFDTEPGRTDPLGGVPPSFVLGHNLPVRFGAELPFSARTSLLISLGFDVHGRAEDSGFMPACAVGLVSSI